ncbi:MAG: type II restriction endonuclease, partial [Candidatus Kapaibacteriota bacterium]
MKLENKTPKSVVNKIYYNLPIEKKSFLKFATELITFRNQIQMEQTEEHNKNILRDFLINTFYRDYIVNSFGDIDLAIKQASEGEPLEVIFEVKNPLNSSEMIYLDDFNRRSFHEVLLYYLREKLEKKNHYLKHIIITNCLQWYVFSASSFEQVFFRNKEFVKKFIDWKSNKYDSSTTGFFYENIAKVFIDTNEETLECVAFDIDAITHNLSLEDATNRIELIELYKFLSPVHLLRRPFANDNNSLNREFYDELLHILGLREVDEGNITIKRLPPASRKPGFLIENTIERLLSRDNFHGSEDEAFEIALELVLT